MLLQASCLVPLVSHMFFHLGVQLWAGCGDIDASFPDNLVSSLLHELPRCVPLTGFCIRCSKKVSHSHAKKVGHC